MPVLMLVKGFDAPVPQTAGRWLDGECVALVEPGTTLSYRESHPPQENGGFYQITIGDRVKSDPDMQAYLEEYTEPSPDPEDPPTLLKRRKLELNQVSRSQLGNGTGYAAWNFAQLELVTDDAENP